VGRELLAAALGYASNGWEVLPLRPGRKEPATAHGLHDASSDVDQVRRWWNDVPAANVGLRTGGRFDILDIDSPDAFERLVGHIGDPDLIPSTRTVKTARGWHLYFRPTGAGNRAGLLPGIDYRGAGGYVVAPPSIHPSGAVYRVTSDTPIAPAPPWLVRLLEPPPRRNGSAVSELLPSVAPRRYGMAALRSEMQAVASAREGNRNDQLNRSAFRLGQLARAGVIDPTPCVNALWDAAVHAGLGDAEIGPTIRSGFTAGMDHPRTRA
jgi:Bifunctional DNA primase/polymerase, N-terminal